MTTLNGKTTNLEIFDADTIEQGGIFLIGELERLDPILHGPYYNATWSRDIDLRSDVSFETDSTSYMKNYIESAKQRSSLEVGFMSADSNVAPNVGSVVDKTRHPFRSWVSQLSYTYKELLASQRVNRPIDIQKHQALMTQYQMSVDRAVYIGSAEYSFTGLLTNADAIANEVTLTGGWSNPATSPKSITNDINQLLTAGWARTNYEICPDRILMNPKDMSVLSERIVSEAGSISVLNYIKKNCICMNVNGREPEILPLKWLAPGIPGAIEQRIVAYTKRQEFLRYPLFPVRRFPELTRQGMMYSAYYYAGLGEMETVYPETLVYGKLPA